MKQGLFFLIIGAIIGFAIGEFRPRPKTETSDTLAFTRKMDSMERQNSLIADSLRITRFVFANREREHEKDMKYVQQRLNEKNEIRFKPTIRDTQRDSVLAELYPTSRILR